MNKSYDAAVIGGGPIGGQVAKKIAEKGFNVAIFEEHKTIGEPLKCAGLVSSRVFDFCSFSKEKIIQNQIKGAHIHSPSGDILTIGGDKVHAYVIDRTKFDHKIIKSAEEKGAELYLENKVLSTQKHNNYIELTTAQKHDIQCKILIGADGPHSKIRDRFSLPTPKEILKGIGVEVINISLDPDYVEIFVGKHIAPGFFSWVIPTNKEGSEARIGLCISPEIKEPPRYFLENILKNKHNLKLFNEIKIIKKTGGAIPLGSLKRTYDDNLLLVGDAAAQVKPTSGGGIYTGLLCANQCSTVASEALEIDNFSSTFLSKYHKLWSSEIGRELFLGMKFRKIFKKLNDEQINKYVKKFQNQKIIDTISNHGDIDYPSKLVKPLLKKNPSLIKLLPSLFKE